MKTRIFVSAVCMGFLPQLQTSAATAILILVGAWETISLRSRPKPVEA